MSRACGQETGWAVREAERPRLVYGPSRTVDRPARWWFRLPGLDGGCSDAVQVRQTRVGNSYEVGRKLPGQRPNINLQGPQLIRYTLRSDLFSVYRTYF